MLRKSLLLIIAVQFLFAAMTFAQMQPNGSMSGKVTNGNGAPIHGATIVASSANPSDSLRLHVSTDWNGNYKFHHLLAGDYSVACMYNGISISYPNAVTIVDSMETSNINFQISNTQGNRNSLSGVVTNSSNSESMSWVSIYLWNNNHEYHTNSNDSGEYRFSRIASGTYKINAYAWNFENYYGVDSFTVNDSTSLSDVNISMTPITANGSISGFVYNSTTGNPIAGAMVELEGDDWNDSGNVAITDSLGAYSISNIWSGEYTIECKAEGYEKQESEDVEIDSAITMDFHLVQIISGTISGTVTKDNDGSPVKHAWIEFISADSGSNNWHHRGTQTDSNGNYSATIPVGNYYVKCSTWGHCWEESYSEYYDNVHTIAEATVVVVAENQTSANINFGIPTPVTIHINVSGTVKDTMNNPIAGAKVQVWSYSRISRDSNSIGISDANGNYSLSVTTTSTSETKFIVSAKKQGFDIEFYNEKSTWQEAEVITTSGDTTIGEINFSLASNGISYNNSISGNVSDAQGVALPGTLVFGYGHGRHRVAMTVADSQGNYSLGQLRQDDYLLFFFKDGYVPEYYNNVYTWETATRVNANGSITGINAVLDTTRMDSSDGKISGIIRGANNTVISGVLVTIKNSAGQVVTSSVTDNAGKYILNGLGAMNYTVVSTKIGFTSTTSSVVVNPTVTVVLNMNLTPTVLSVNNDEVKNIPSTVTLKDNYPNPFNPSTMISFGIPEAQTVRISIYNVLGQKVTELVNEFLPAGNYSVTWNAKDNGGNSVSSGMYFYSLETGATSVVKKMILTK